MNKKRILFLGTLLITAALCYSPIAWRAGFEARPVRLEAGKTKSKKIYTLKRGESIRPGDFNLSIENAEESFVFLVQDRRRQVYAIRNGKRLGPYRDAFFPGFSKDGKEWGFLAQTRSRQVVVVTKAGEFGPYMDASPLRFSLDGRRLGFEALTGRGGLVAVIDGREFGPYRDRSYGSLRFSRNGSRWALRTQDPGQNFIVVDGRQFGPYQRATAPALSPDGRHWGTRVQYGTQSYTVVVDGRDLGSYLDVANDSPAFGAGSRNFGFGAKKQDGNWYVIFGDGRELGPYSYASAPVFSPNGRRWMVAVKKSGGWYVLLNNKQESGPYGLAYSLTLSNDGSRQGFMAKKSDGEYVIIDGREFGPYRDAFSLSFTEDGRRWGFKAIRHDGKRVVVVDGRSFGPYKDAHPVAFSSNGQLCIFRAEESKGRWYVVLCDGRRFGPYAFAFEPELAADGSHWGVRLKRRGYLIDGREYKGVFCHRIVKKGGEEVPYWLSRKGRHVYLNWKE